jgi:hypothetical protein
MVGMSNMIATSSNNSEKQSSTQITNNTHNPLSVNTLTNMSDYQTAQALTVQARALFNNQLASKQRPNTTATSQYFLFIFW